MHVSGYAADGSYLGSWQPENLAWHGPIAVAVPGPGTGVMFLASLAWVGLYLARGRKTPASRISGRADPRAGNLDHACGRSWPAGVAPSAVGRQATILVIPSASDRRPQHHDDADCARRFGRGRARRALNRVTNGARSAAVATGEA